MHKGHNTWYLEYFYSHWNLCNPHAQWWGVHCCHLTTTDHSFIRALLNQNHMIYLDEIQEQLLSCHGVKVSITTLCCTLWQLHFTHKDERTSNRHTGWSRQGSRCVQRKCFVQGKRFSILPIITLDGIIAHDIIEGSVTSKKFYEFLHELVVCICFPLCMYTHKVKFRPYPRLCSVLILNNCWIHHAKEIQQLVKDEASMSPFSTILYMNIHVML
jgi:hypothetical protein